MDSISAFVLPDEIWFRIFAYYLPLEDRKNIRLTCRHFYDVCNDTRIQGKEEFVFNGNIITVSAILSLCDSSRKIWNIKLNCVSVIEDTIVAFFEKQGTNVRSLTFQKCTFSSGILKSIIENCKGLRCIALIFPPNRDENRFLEHIFSDFKALENNFIVRPDVTDFTFIVPFSNEFSNLKFLRFFAVFPSIRRLDLEIDLGREFDQFSTISADIRSDDVFSFSSVYSQLSVMSDQIGKLRLHFENNPSYQSCFSVERLIQISNIEMRNLKEFSLNWINLMPDLTVMHPFLELRNLTHFDFEISNRYVTSALVSTFLQQLLSTSTPLYSLKFTHYNFCIDRELFRAFVRSKLKILRIHMKDDYPSVLSASFRQSTLENTLLPNYNLEDLYFERETRDLMLLFSTYFRNLKTLEFPEVHEGVMQNIFEHQIRIHRLTLHNCKRWPCTKCTFRSLRAFLPWLEKEKTTMKREFKYLSSLYIREDKYCLSNLMLREFMFPKLKSLTVCIHFKTKTDPFVCEELWQNIHKLPQLQYLKLELPVDVSFQQWLALFGGQSKLRHFHIEDKRIDLLLDAEYRGLFDSFPSLRIVEHRLKDSLMTCAKYFYDFTTKTVMNISESCDKIYVGPNL